MGETRKAREPVIAHENTVTLAGTLRSAQERSHGSKLKWVFRGTITLAERTTLLGKPIKQGREEANTFTVRAYEPLANYLHSQATRKGVPALIRGELRYDKVPFVLIREYELYDPKTGNRQAYTQSVPARSTIEGTVEGTGEGKPQ